MVRQVVRYPRYWPEPVHAEVYVGAGSGASNLYSACGFHIRLRMSVRLRPFVLTQLSKLCHGVTIHFVVIANL